MRKLLSLALIVCLVACNGTVKEKNQESVAEMALVGNYGDKIDAEGAISTEEMIKMLDSADSANVKVAAEITATCAKKGCWMNMVMENGEEMRVTFKDYAFFVPKEGMEGNRAVIEGVVVRTLTDVATLKHFAEDAGKTQIEIDAITEAKEEMTFEATGVIIYSDSE